MYTREKHAQKSAPPENLVFEGCAAVSGARCSAEDLRGSVDPLELPYFSASFTAMKALVLAKLQEPPTCMSRATAAPVA